MTTTESRPPIAAGEPAPDFSLPAVDGAPIVSLAEYRGRSPVFLALLLGLWCPFCRRYIARMGATEAKLKAEGVETVCVVATPPENAKLYFKFRPTKLRLAADPHLATHHAYGVQRAAVTPEFMAGLAATKINPTGELPTPLPVMEAAAKLAEIDGYAGTPVDQADMERQFPQLKAQFLIDQSGVIRWTNYECAKGLTELGKMASDEEILAAVRTLR